MTTPRSSPYVYATWPAKYLTGDKSCLWACWFKTHHQNYDKAPSDFDLVRWQAEHTVLVNSLVNDLEKQGCEVFIVKGGVITCQWGGVKVCLSHKSA